MQFCWVVQRGETPAPEFHMGRRGRDEDADAEPVRLVRLTIPFLLGAFPVTQAQFAAWTSSPQYREQWWPENREKLAEHERDREHSNAFGGYPDRPAENVSWYEACGFCEWLNGNVQQ